MRAFSESRVFRVACVWMILVISSPVLAGARKRPVRDSVDRLDTRDRDRDGGSLVPQPFVIPDLQYDHSANEWFVDLPDESRVVPLSPGLARYEVEVGGQTRVAYYRVTGLGSAQAREATLRIELLESLDAERPIAAWTCDLEFGEPYPAAQPQIRNLDVNYRLVTTNGQVAEGLIRTEDRSVIPRGTEDTTQLTRLGSWAPHETAEPAELYIPLTPPHILAGVAIIVIVGVVVAGVWEAADGDYVCTGWWNWWWNGCWW